MKKLLLCKKSLNIYTLVFAGVVMGLMSFVSSPQKEEIIKSLRQDYKMVLTDLKTWQKIAVKSINGRRVAEQKAKVLEKENISLKSTPGIIVPEPKIQYVKERLSGPDSLRIAEVLFDTIYAKKIELLRKEVKPIQVK